MASNSSTPVVNLIQAKRLKNESRMMRDQPLRYITAYPDEKNPLIWYFLLVGQKGTQYHGGHYIGEIHHSPQYPAKPPDYYMRTPSGRYEINKKICLTNSSYHSGDWSPTWNIHSILIAFYSIWLDDKEHGISHIVRSKEERKRLAEESIEYNQTNHRQIYEKFDFANLTDDVDGAPVPTQTAVAAPTQTVTVVTTPTETNVVQVTQEVQTVQVSQEVQTVQIVQEIQTVQVTTQNTTSNDDGYDSEEVDKMTVQEQIKAGIAQPTSIPNVFIIDDTKNKSKKKKETNIDFDEMFRNIDKMNDQIQKQEEKINELMSQITYNK